MEKEKANGLGHSSANLRNYYATHGDQSKICFHYIFHQFSDQVYCLTHIWEITIKKEALYNNKVFKFHKTQFFKKCLKHSPILTKFITRKGIG